MVWPVGVLLDLRLDLDDYRRPEHGIGIMDVGAWLRSLGLAQYEALFRQNDIDAEVLGDLTDADRLSATCWAVRPNRANITRDVRNEVRLDIGGGLGEPGP